jgi:hypothetical protein
VRWFADRRTLPTTVSGMKSVLWVAVAALALVAAESTPARDASSCETPAKSTKQGSPPQARQPKVYGTPIQPPIVKKRAPRKTKATAATSTSKPDAAKRKSNAEAARKAKADLQWRREHPASADGPR